MSWNLKRNILFFVGYFSILVLMSVQRRIENDKINNILEKILYNDLTLLLLMVISIALAIYLFREEFTTPVWVKTRFGILKLIGIGISTSIAIIAIQNIISMVLEVFAVQLTLSDINAADDSEAHYFSIFFFIIFTAPIMEEIIFRRIIFIELEKKTKFFIAAIISSLTFAFLHGDFENLYLYTIGGFLFAYAYKRSGTIYVPIIAHMMNNISALVLGFI